MAEQHSLATSCRDNKWKPGLYNGGNVPAAFQCLAGLLGPWMIGVVKTKYGGYHVPMVILTVVNSLAVVYWAVLARFLPIKEGKAKKGAWMY